MPAPSFRTPSYRLHKPSGQGVVTLEGRDFYVGKHGTPESRAECNRLVVEWLANGRRIPAQTDRTIYELIPPYIRHCESYYVKDDKVTTQVALVRGAARVLREMYGATLVKDFGPVAMKTCRAEFVRQGLSRKECNRRTGLIKQLFKWAVENELAPPSVYHGLQAVSGLRKGRCEATDPDPVQPVSQEHLDAVLPYLTPTVRSMVLVQLWSGMRPDEVTQLRAIDLEMNGPTWQYRPASHKNEHHGKDRVIFLGPKVQAVLRERLTNDLNACLFRPEDAAAERTSEQRKRKSPTSPTREYGNRYSTCSYRRAIQRACERAGVPHWSPNQLRHSCATRLRREFGLDVAGAILGHSSLRTTEVYAEIDQRKAAEAMERVG